MLRKVLLKKSFGRNPLFFGFWKYVEARNKASAIFYCEKIHLVYFKWVYWEKESGENFYNNERNFLGQIC